MIKEFEETKAFLQRRCMETCGHNANENCICKIALCLNEIEKAEEELAKYKKLEGQLGCPLEGIAKLRKANCIYRDDGLAFGFIGINFNDEDKLILYNDDEWCTFTSELRLADHKKTWWLKEDRSE